ncbi:MAG: macrocin O-methyltransferase [Desulfobacterales bacterium]|nr:macrocin O-methyltransferase [Desulfobacterales bacterium]
MNPLFILKKIARAFGLEIKRTRTESFSPDIPAAFVDTYKKVRSYTMTSPDRIFSLCEAVKYVQDKNIAGDIVECGVWKGGSMMAVAETLLQTGDPNRSLYLFDTFEGMPPPTENDVDISGMTAKCLLETSDMDRDESVWCRANLDVVAKALDSTGYPSERIKLIKGMVEQTIPHLAPEKIALLRLDTDWYESTKHEMEQLFPRLTRGGVLIIDDYGHWQGARKAVDEYLENNNVKILLNRIDYTGRIAVKI